MRISFFLSLALLASSAHGAEPAAAPGLQPSQLAIVINDAEPNSIEVGEYYRQAHAIPAANVVHVHIPNRLRKLSMDQFAQLKERIDGQLKPGIQAVLMVWSAPYAVECNSITSAFTLGYDAGQCAKSCGAGKASNYFNSNTGQPFSQLGMRLSMLLPIDFVEEAKAVVDRGTASGFAVPAASAYYLSTSEGARNSRAAFFPPAGVVRQRKLTIKSMKADVLEGAQDIMVYQTGMAKVDKLDTLHFLPGALADHLTSFGGDLQGTAQMSSQRWLEAGATASYGTVSEPCNYWQKFPNPTVLLRRYLSGMTALEAYWGSVAWPAQGLFIGDPLAAPYASFRR
ncbi:TIGR03790 family protein [Janthinobacterium sp. GW460P]|uniref:TIGR03790 family protein n=1 Tax=unclassified Janthinobacterium TaxID=2610881 RepID=UPI000A328C88|nr:MULTISPECIES: TIGR03790 family protein [unclassified Janthinobacterium]MCC7701286.1 TIGR03790 family protein [Janthinobacterium sp. GW460P]MCC7706793.1 TIGR03790 family protein [Janthinobacterium sp. GW460W]